MPCFYIKKCFVAILPLLFVYCQLSLAQQPVAGGATVTLSGKVLDDFGHPLSGVKVNAKGSSTAAVTNAAGLFQVEVPVGNRITFAHPLYNIAEVNATNNKDITIKLTERYLHHYTTPAAIAEAADTLMIGQRNRQMVDVLYGQKDARQVLGSISTVYSNQLSTTPASLYLYALPGR